MLRVTQWIGSRDSSGAADGEGENSLSLPFELRQRSRLRTTLTSGREVLLQLPRGRVLRHGDRLRAEDGTLIRVESAPETLSVVHSTQPLLLARAAYHLGNRHVALQIDVDRVCYLHDHVLDAMIEKLGLAVSVEQLPFEPEAGAYGHGSSHGRGASGHSHHEHHGHHSH